MLRTIRWLALATLGLQIIAGGIRYVLLPGGPLNDALRAGALSDEQFLQLSLLISVAHVSALAIAVVLLVAAAQAHRWLWFAPVLLLTVLLALEGIAFQLTTAVLIMLYPPIQPPGVESPAPSLDVIVFVVVVGLQTLAALAALAFSFRRSAPSVDATGTRGSLAEAASIAGAAAPAHDASH